MKKYKLNKEKKRILYLHKIETLFHMQININTKQNESYKMDGPWYETQSPSRDEVIDEIDKSWFITNLRLTRNEYHKKYSANKILRQKYVDFYNKKHKITLKNFSFNPDGKCIIPNPKHVTITFEAINSQPDAKSILSKIIDEEITKVEKKGFGSYRGFQTFVIRPLEESIMKRAIQEIWCVVIIKKNMNKLTKKWIENRFAPGGKGYLEAKERFENNDYTIS